MQQAIDLLEQAIAALLTAAAEQLARDPDVAVNVLSIRNQAKNLQQQLKDSQSHANASIA